MSQPQHADGRVVAAFDFDGTLTHGDSLRHFIPFVRGWPRTLLGYVLISPWLLGFVLHLVSRTHAKERVLRHFFGGWPQARLQEHGERFAREAIPGLLKPEAVAAFRNHQAAGHRCVLISASPDVYLHPWAQAMGFDHALTSELVTDAEGAVTGRLRDGNCWGPEKTRRLLAWLGERDGYEIYAYGDSRGDRELLALADHPGYREFPPL
jgi:phosphatidylglycerophosphatase C